MIWNFHFDIDLDIEVRKRTAKLSAALGELFRKP
jgi:hypothetical protein